MCRSVILAYFFAATIRSIAHAILAFPWTIIGKQKDSTDIRWECQICISAKSEIIGTIPAAESTRLSMDLTDRSNGSHESIVETTMQIAHLYGPV